jgi:hypothetical protein
MKKQVDKTRARMEEQDAGALLRLFRVGALID